MKRGFTLVEMLVAMGILIVLAALTYSMVNVTVEGDRIRSGAREVQSYLEGARNQAIYAKEPRGVRFVIDSEDDTVVTSMVYVGAPSKITEGSLGVVYQSDILTIPATVQAVWKRMKDRGLLVDGARIKIPKNGGLWYTISQNGPDNWQLTKRYEGTDGTEAYELELAPAVLPFQEPKLLPSRIAIDLDNCQLPLIWGSGPYSRQMDVLFSPTGNVIGTVGAFGNLHFVLSDTSDTVLNCPLNGLTTAWAASSPYAPGNWVVAPTSTEYQFLCTIGGTTGAAPPPEFSTPVAGTSVTDGTAVWLCHSRRPSVVVSLTTMTGNTASYSLHPNDPFLYAETGQVAR